MAKIIDVVPILELRKNKPKAYGLLFEHSFKLTAGVKGDIENRDYENEEKAIAKADCTT